MKNFELNRFKKVVVRDFHNTYSLFGMSMLIIMLIPAFVWLMGLAVNDDVVEVWNRRNFISLAVYITAAISSMKIYNSCNLVGKGNYFALLPASLCEKFTSMVLYSFVVCPLVVFAGSVAVDTILTLLPFGPYKEFLWQLPDWMKSIGDNTFIFPTSIGGYVLSALNIFAVAALFMLANTIFKKNKFIKTILWLMLITFALVLIIAPIAGHFEWGWNWIDKLAEWFKDKTEEQIIRIYYWSHFVFNAVVIFFLSFFTYRRLKKMQY
ncbi:MAG: hypothetical protein J5848_07375 [Bacteroidales bacterium]|nr:hypothetical protein [Bacteroidales bacterium]